MKIKYFTDTDTTLIEFSKKEISETKEVSENIYIDIDKNGNIINMTIEPAKSNSENWEFSYQEMQMGNRMVVGEM